MVKKSKRRCDTLPILHPDAAGIDVGATELYVAVSADRDPHPVRCFPHVHSRSACVGRLACAVRDSFCRDGVNQRVLDSRLPDTGSTRSRSLPGQRTAREERARPKDRCIRLPVAPVPTLGWPSPRQFSATWIHLRHTISLETPRQPDSDGS